MFKHILIPLDGSQHAERAIPYATEIATPHSKITLLSVLEIPITLFPISASPPALPQETVDYELHRTRRVQQANEYLIKMQGPFEGIVDKIETKVIIGKDPADKILTFSEQHAVDVIVMATRGHSGFTRWLLGSVTNKVLQATSCPVVVVPSQ